MLFFKLDDFGPETEHADDLHAAVGLDEHRRAITFMSTHEPKLAHSWTSTSPFSQRCCGKNFCFGDPRAAENKPALHSHLRDCDPPDLNGENSTTGRFLPRDFGLAGTFASWTEMN
ncbi:MAG: hypothetical protein ACI91O_001449 [Candidatus Poriferisodalaceae bacterium]